MKTLSIGKLVYDINILTNGYPNEGAETETSEVIECCGGSAGIVAYALGKWNMESYISGVIGYDNFGAAMKKNMEENKVRLNYLETNYDVKTKISYILLNKQNNRRTIIETKLKDFNIKKYEYDMDMDLVIVDGTEYNASAYALNKYQNSITILNAKEPKPGLLNYFKLVKYAICDGEVAESMTGLKFDFNNPVTLATIYKKIIDKYPNINLIINVEGKGTIYSVNNEIKVLATINTNAIDITGAKDIFASMISYGLINKYDMETTIRLATIAESMAKKTIGSTLSIPLLSDIVSYYEDKFGPIKTILKESTREESIELKEPLTTSQTPEEINTNISKENEGEAINQVFGINTNNSGNDDASAS